MKIWKNKSIQNLNGEIWKDVENFSGYEISNLGRVKKFNVDETTISNIKTGGRTWNHVKGEI